MSKKRETALTVKELIEELKKYPPDAKVHAYEGEIIGIIITDKDSGRELAEILTTI